MSQQAPMPAGHPTRRSAPPPTHAHSADDFHKILTEPESNMIKQQQALLATENVELIFTGGSEGRGFPSEAVRSQALQAQVLQCGRHLRASAAGRRAVLAPARPGSRLLRPVAVAPHQTSSP